MRNSLSVALSATASQCPSSDTAVHTRFLPPLRRSSAILPWPSASGSAAWLARAPSPSTVGAALPSTHSSTWRGYMQQSRRRARAKTTSGLCGNGGMMRGFVRPRSCALYATRFVSTLPETSRSLVGASARARMSCVCTRLVPLMTHRTAPATGASSSRSWTTLLSTPVAYSDWPSRLATTDSTSAECDRTLCATVPDAASQNTTLPCESPLTMVLSGRIASVQTRAGLFGSLDGTLKRLTVRAFSMLHKRMVPSAEPLMSVRPSAAQATLRMRPFCPSSERIYRSCPSDRSNRRTEPSSQPAASTEPVGLTARHHTAPPYESELVRGCRRCVSHSVISAWCPAANKRASGVHTSASTDEPSTPGMRLSCTQSCARLQTSTSALARPTASCAPSGLNASALTAVGW
eukprot:Unigene10826_Nuclearia_a/m.33062 Unigene10826_Nuclearia_a/g.33062  ORF Unigene10826_Nuclearia_a/g.33062 Unigene10826_Nuclearia_a/m.33062 type:complete len:406 (-) Unigene10826_Nuclearia_a:77-1294(-)